MTTKTTFEAAMNKLEEIAAKLESGELSLEDSLKAYQEGIELVKLCSEKLAKSESQINILVEKGKEIVVQSSDV